MCAFQVFLCVHFCFTYRPIPTLMRCAPRTQIPQISCYTKYLTVVKGFSKDLVSVRTSQAIRWKKWSSVRTALAIRWKKNVIHPFDGLRKTQANPFEENFHSIEQLGLSVGKLSSVRGARVIRSKKIVIRLNGSRYPDVQNNCQPRYCSKSLSPKTFATKIM